jgi:hypothetical protein
VTDLADLRRRVGIRDGLPPRKEPTALEEIFARASALPDPAARKRPKKTTRPAPRPAVPTTAGDPYATQTRPLRTAPATSPGAARAGEPSVVAGLLAALQAALTRPVIVNVHYPDGIQHRLRPDAEKQPPRDASYP